MLIIPAVDIKDGKVVRLERGHFDQMTVYSDDPVAVAQKWESCGAKLLHVVDLDGAQMGKAKNFNVIDSLVSSVPIPVQLGGGIRTQYDIACFLTSGVSRVVLATKAIESREFLKEVLKEWTDKIIVSLDCIDGVVADRGWQRLCDLKAIDFAPELESLGVKTLIYTDINRDGTLTGPNIENIAQLLQSVHIPVIASGGISSLEDLKKLQELEPKGLMGVITGKALYEGRLDLKEAISICSPKG